MTDHLVLRLLATTDLHGWIMHTDYLTGQPVSHGLLALSGQMTQARKEQPLTLLLDNGDLIQGTALAEQSNLRLRGTAVHPFHELMAQLGYDAATLGNHDFNFGLELTQALVRSASFPYVCANVSLPGGEPLCPRGCLIVKDTPLGPLKVGITGAVPPQILEWDAHLLRGKLEVQEMVPAVASAVRELRDNGADVVVLLAHSGLSPSEHSRATSENAVLALARLPGITAIVAGHAHRRFPGEDYAGLPDVDHLQGQINGVPVVMPAALGHELGLIDLTLEQKANGWQVTDTKVSTRAPQDDNGQADRTLPAGLPALVAAHQAALEAVQAPVARLTAPVDTYWAQVYDNAAVRLINDVQRQAVARLLPTLPDAPALPLLSAAAAFKVGGLRSPHYYTHLPAGQLSVRHIADLYPYDNVLQAVRVTGTDLREWLERSVSCYQQLVAGRRVPLLHPDYPSFDLDVIGGLSYEVNLAQPPRYDALGQVIDPAAQRISGLTYQGSPVPLAAEFIVATNHYRAASSTFPMLGTDKVVLDTGRAIRDVIIEAFREQGKVTPVEREDWRLTAPPGSVADFRTSPDARPPRNRTGTGTDADQGPSIQPVQGLDSDGFQHYLLRFPASPSSITVS